MRVAEKPRIPKSSGRRGLNPTVLLLSAVRDDPVAWPLMQELLGNGSPAMIMLLFQLHAVDVEDITKRGKRVSKALAAGTAGWNYAEGLWVGALDFGRAFLKTIRAYRGRVEALVEYCDTSVSATLLGSNSYEQWRCSDACFVMRRRAGGVYVKFLAPHRIHGCGATSACHHCLRACDSKAATLQRVRMTPTCCLWTGHAGVVITAW